MTAGPLARFTVLDLTRVRAGPTAVRYLADWGANCIKVEMPPSAGEMDMGGPRHGPDFQNLHRNKRSVTLNLKEPDGRAIFMKMVEKADVVVENYRADVKFRLGIDYESLKKVNPRIILGSISGFGQDGPYAERAGFDQIAQGMGGLMWVTGMPGQGPVRAGIAVADVGAGLHCAIGILTALLERETSGEGQWISTSLLQAMISMCDFQAARWTLAKDVPGQAGNNHPTSIPTGVFKTKDGYINIAASGGHIYKRFCECVAAPELMTDERFSTDKAEKGGFLGPIRRPPAPPARLRRPEESAIPRASSLLRAGASHAAFRFIRRPHPRHRRTARPYNVHHHRRRCAVATCLLYTSPSPRDS